MGCKDCDSCGKSCGDDIIYHDEVADRWLRELRLERERAAKAAAKQNALRKPVVTPVLSVRMPKEVLCPSCEGSCEELDGTPCQECQGLGIVKEDD